MTATRSVFAQHRIPVSAQRVAIYEYLAKVKTHPSADMVFEAMKDRLPSLSRTTVYNTLHLFCEKGLARQIPGDGEQMRFDGDLSPHCHFRCNDCGEVFDIPVPEKALAGISAPSGFETQGADILLKGCCPECISRRTGKIAH